MTRADARRALGSLTWFAVTLVALMYLLGIETMLPNRHINALVAYDYGRNFPRMAWIMPLLAVLPMGASFCQDWSGQFIVPQILRVGQKKYTLSKLLSTALSGGLVLCLGSLLFFAACCLWFPLAGYAQHFSYGPNLGDAVQLGGAWLFVASSASLYLLGGAFYALCGLAFSAWWPNPYLALAMPLMINKVSAFLAARFALPFYLNIGMVLDGASGLYFWPTMALGAAVFGGLMLLCCLAFAQGVRRRLQHG